MSELRIRTIDEDDIDTVLAEDIDFDGELNFEKPLLIKGRFKGKITAAGDLFINREAHVEATVEANIVSVKGHIDGDVHAKSRLELFSSARLSGNIRTPDLIMQSGCIFNGTCEMAEVPETKEEQDEKAE